MACRKRILFLAEGATMAHFVRPLALAEGLDPERHEVHFYAPARFSSFLTNPSFSIGELATLPGEQFLDNIAAGKPLFPADTIRAYIEQDRALIRSIRPDVVIGDMRLSLAISARLENTRYAAVFNAYWSPYAKRRPAIPSLPVTRFLPVKLFGPLYRAAEPRVWAVHAGEMNRVRRDFGMPDLPPDLRVMYTDGDFVLYADIPEFVPTPGRPESHRYVGICDWSPPVPKPPWWDRMRSDPNRKVFVTLGSSGPLHVLPALFRALSRLRVTVVISTSGRPMPDVPKGAYTAPLLPFRETARESHVVVSHGGSGGMYPAIAAGTPVLGLPSNADQHLSTAVLVENEAGCGIRSEEASGARLQRVLDRLLEDTRYASAAQRWASIFARYDSGALFREFVGRIA